MARSRLGIYKGQMQRRDVAIVASRRCALCFSVNTFLWNIFSAKAIKCVKNAAELSEGDAIQDLKQLSE